MPQEPEPLDLDSPTDAKKTPRPPPSLLDRATDEISRPPSPAALPDSPSVLQRTVGFGKAVVRAAVETERDNQQHVRDEIEATKNAASHLYSGTETGTRPDHGDEALPHVGDGEGEPPVVKYTQDIVLDMDGYHTVRDSPNGAAVKDARGETLGGRDDNKQFEEGPSTPRSGSPSRHPSPERTPSTSRTKLIFFAHKLKQ